MEASQMTATPKILPCPFCGREVSEKDIGERDEWRWVVCRYCEAEGPTWTDKYGAISLWNKAKR